MTDTGREPWYRREPERLAWELGEFQRHGLPSEESYDEGGRLVVATEVQFRGEPLGVRAFYPHGYPYLAPTIIGDRLVVQRHQEPLTRNFCLLEDPGGDWRPWDSAARLIDEDLRRLLRDFEKSDQTVHAGEADMPEPVSAQFPYDDGQVVLVGDPFLTQELAATGGSMDLIRGPSGLLLLSEAKGIGSLDRTLAERIAATSCATLQGRWLALDFVPRPEEGILNALTKADGELLARLGARVTKRKGRRRAAMLVGVTFLEEGPVRDERRRTWLFAEIVQEKSSKPQVTRRLQAQALSANERRRRLPELRGIEDSHVIVVGAGSLGAPIILELAKAGIGRLELFDGDHYDINNAVRHLLPAEKAGCFKAEEVAKLCQAVNPFVDVCGHALDVGTSAVANDLLTRALKTASVVIDTTGVQAVARFVEAETVTAGASLIVAGLTANSLGADVLLIERGGACLDCFIWAQDAGSIPKPPEGSRSTVTPIGCRHPAFSGAGFEATELAAIVARRAVQASAATLYPGTSSNWIVLDFRGGAHFQEGRLAPVAECHRHPR